MTKGFRAGMGSEAYRAGGTQKAATGKARSGGVPKGDAKKLPKPPRDLVRRARTGS